MAVVHLDQLDNGPEPSVRAGRKQLLSWRGVGIGSSRIAGWFRAFFKMNNTLSEKDVADLKETLKRCSPETIEAAIRFREQRDPEALRTVVYGVIRRYQPANAGMRLDNATDDTSLIQDLGLDSLTLLEIVLTIEETLKIQINNEELKEIRTLGTLNKFLKDKIAGATSAPTTKQYAREHIALVLPQQPPFMFLDTAEMGEETVKALYQVKGDEFFLAGHFKDDPIFPASVLFEALGQAACLWVLEKAPKLLSKEIKTNHIFFASLDGAHVYRKVRPGQQLTLETKLVKLRDPVAIFSCTASSNGDRVAAVERLVLAFGEQLAPEEPATTAAAAAPTSAPAATTPPPAATA
jgi:3-hydroxyacyl-[acyl-carrier-protein] dehydratase